MTATELQALYRADCEKACYGCRAGFALINQQHFSDMWGLKPFPCKAAEAIDPFDVWCAAKLTEALEDTARWDALPRVGYVLWQSDEGPWKVRAHTGEVITFEGETPRAAIDAARKGK